MFSRALLAMRFANAVESRVSVKSGATCKQRSNDSWLVSGFLWFAFSKNIRADIVVILDVFARSARNDVRARI